MPALRSHTRSRATMYGLADHAGRYERVARLLTRRLHRGVVADVVALALPAGALVVDVGTGPGLLPEALARACPALSVVGVDLAPAMVERARERCGDSPGLRFEVGDAAALPFDDGSVDLVVSSISLHHWEDPRAGLADVVRVLRPGAEAWVYDARRTVGRAVALVTGLPVEVRVEPARGLGPVRLARLVLRRTR